ncbi:MAG: SseB family protein [Proteobacteria bacterium]|nr:SseB family protein [Pseudomonadota bacterium]
MGGAQDAGQGSAREAFVRLLGDAQTSEQARVDALVALSQRTVFVATWPGLDEEIRTLTNSEGTSAMPVFTDVNTLDLAARRYGWVNPDGSVLWREIGARAAFRQALVRELDLFVVDIGTAHSVEFARPEIEPLIDARLHDTTKGPFAGAGKVSESILKAVRKSQPPASLADSLKAAQQPLAPVPPLPAHRGPVPLPSIPHAAGMGASLSPARQASSRQPPSGPAAASATVVNLVAPSAQMADDVLNALAASLRDYPEVEWAAEVGRADAPRLRMIGLRLDPSYTERAQQIIAGMREASAMRASPIEVMLLTDPAAVRAARQHGRVFFPWRSK